MGNGAGAGLDYCVKGYCIYSTGSSSEECKALSTSPGDKRFGVIKHIYGCSDKGISTEYGLIEVVNDYCWTYDNSGNEYITKITSAPNPFNARDSTTHQCIVSPP